MRRAGLMVSLAMVMAVSISVVVAVHSIGHPSREASPASITKGGRRSWRHDSGAACFQCQADRHVGGFVGSPML